MWVDDTGIYDKPLFTWRHISWDRFIGYTIGWAGRGNPIPSMTVYGVGGQAMFTGLPVLIERVIETAHPILRQRTLRDFKPFLLTNDTLAHERKGLLRFSEIESIQLDSVYDLVIRKRDKRLAWININLRHVNNGLLLVEDFVDRGLPFSLRRDGVHVPVSVRARLAKVGTR